MERLTEWTDNGEELYAVENPHIRDNGARRCLKKLAELEDAEEKGKLFLSPFAIGESYWRVCEDIDIPGIEKITVDGIVLNCEGSWTAECVDSKGHRVNNIYTDHIGITVFAKKEDAEKRLKELDKKVSPYGAMRILFRELECVKRAKNCDRDCAKCDLVMDPDNIIQAYKIAINAIDKSLCGVSDINAEMED